MHDCVKVAIEHITGETIITPKEDHRGYYSTEIAMELWQKGWSLTVFEGVVNLITDSGEYETHLITDLDPEQYGDCLVEVTDHAIAYVDGKYYWTKDQEVDKPEMILALWVPRRFGT